MVKLEVCLPSLSPTIKLCVSASLLNAAIPPTYIVEPPTYISSALTTVPINLPALIVPDGSREFPATSIGYCGFAVLIPILLFDVSITITSDKSGVKL